jgi:hypothetical protein
MTTEGVQVTLVPPEFINQVWPEITEYLEGAVEYTYGRYEVEDIYDAITRYGHNLWIAFYGPKIKGAVVTNIMHYPRKTCLNMVFCGGVDLAEWKAPMLRMLQQWAHDQHCDNVELTGRPGWAKIFKNDGNHTVWHTSELPVADTGLGARDG